MSTDLTAAGSNSPRNEQRPDRPQGGTSGKPASGGFFSIYKPGQGYWTRLGAALGAAAVILFIAWFVFRESAIFVNRTGPRYGIAAGVVALLALVTWWLMNAPSRAQFLIDTDSEMKKVNWANWSELIGSTRIVIFFMLLTAATLFIFDTQFHAFFFGLNVWHIPFDPQAGEVTGFVLGAVLGAIGFGLLKTSDNKTAKIAGVACAAAAVAIILAWIVFMFVQTPSATPVAAG